MTMGTKLRSGMGRTALAVARGIGSSRVGSCMNMFLAVVASLRSLARIQPFCTNVSLPSGRTSLMVAMRSTSGVDDLTHRWTAPAPIAARLLVSGSDTYDRAVPAGFCSHFHSHFDAALQRPPPPVLPE